MLFRVRATARTPRVTGGIVRIIKLLDQAERDALKEKHKGHNNFNTHIKCVIDKPYCYLANLFAKDYSEVLIHSWVPNDGNNPLLVTINHINSNERFLDGPSRGLQNDKVREYLSQFYSYLTNLQDCFIALGDCFVLDENGLNVTDGMHRLVAYGLASKMDEKFFPIPIYLGTDTYKQS